MSTSIAAASASSPSVGLHPQSERWVQKAARSDLAALVARLERRLDHQPRTPVDPGPLSALPFIRS